MADDRLQVDVAALQAAGFNLGRWSELAHDIAGRIEQATQQYAHAGGTGKMGEMFTKHYKPGEEKAIEFLRMLQKEIGGSGQRVINVAKSFEQTNDDAEQSVRNS
jgi:hypothetical protein